MLGITHLLLKIYQYFKTLKYSSSVFSANYAMMYRVRGKFQSIGVVTFHFGLQLQ
jgi:hypothetical protein